MPKDTDFIELTKKLIAIQSTADKPTELKRCADLLADYFKDSQLVVRRYEQEDKPSLVITSGKKKTPQVFLNGHFDVVPGEPEQFQPQIKAGRLYGRGAYDMKGAVAVMVCLMRDLALERSPLLEKVGLMLVGDEEVGGFNGSKYLLAKGYKPRCLVVGEPTDFKIGDQAKGILWLKMVAKGKSAHGAYPWKGDNAVLKMTRAVNRIADQFPVPDKEVWETMVNVGRIEGGQAANIVPSHCEVTLDFRYVPGEDIDALVERVRILVSDEVELRLVMREPAVVSHQEDKYAVFLKKGIEEVLGQKAVFVSKHGSSDARFFSEVGVAAFEFGPIGSGHHSEAEWVKIQSLVKYYKVIKEIVKSVLE